MDRMTAAVESRPDPIADLQARWAAEHAREVAEGCHDDQCEYGSTRSGHRLLLCHCSKRRRESAGHTETPGEDLEFPPPTCPRCHGGLYHDEGWNCASCSLHWSGNGSASSCSFTDDFGDLGGDEA